jgi:membrane fusion protein, multidrug efflux system
LKVKTFPSLCAGLLVALTPAIAYAQPAGMMPGGMPGASAAIEVGYIEMQPTTVPLTTVLPGRVAASATAQVRPQVGGVVTSVAVEEGHPVSAGDLLFTIDDTLYQAQVAAAEASVASAQAQLPSAQSTVARYEALVDSGGVTQSDLETARVALAQARAAVQSAEAQLKLQQISLEQTKITAPISGMLGSVTAEVGALVTAGQSDALATIRTTDPAYIELTESSANILSYRPAAGTQPSEPPPSPTVNVTLEDGRLYGEDGTISSADFVVSETTGTVTLRATMPNPDHLLLPGMFVRAHITVGEQENAFLVPQRAVTFDAQGQPNAYFVGADNTADLRQLTATRDMNNAWVVTAGVNAGDKLIVDGLQKIDNGTSISPVAVTITDNGVIYQDVGTTTAPAAADATTPAETN